MAAGKVLYDSIGHLFGNPQVEKPDSQISYAVSDEEIRRQYSFSCIIRGRNFFGLVAWHIK